MKPQPAHPTAPALDDDARACLSALTDGDAQALDRALGHWRADVEARRTWHAYQLIGDVMRSEDLARPVARDADFLAGLRARLAAEPVLLAPQPEAPAATVRARRQPWLLPVAAAAGFVAVAGVLVVTRLSQPDLPAAATMAGNSPAGVVLVSTGASQALASPAGVGAGADVLLRDERLDEFLRAHQFARGGAAVAAPGGLRRVEISVPTLPVATPAR